MLAGDPFPLTITITIGAAALVAITGIVVKFLLDRKKRNGEK